MHIDHANGGSSIASTSSLQPSEGSSAQLRSSASRNQHGPDSSNGAETHADVNEDDDDDDDRRLLILYASQTGSAQDVAEYIGREAWRRHFRARVVNIAEFDRQELLEAPPTIIVTSTTGQGQFPSSLLPVWNFLLRSDLPQDLLQDFSYGIFGLGDSSYPKFNWPARKLKRRLDMLGATEICEKGEADDQHYLGIDGSLAPWLDALWSTLLQHFPLHPHQHIRAATARPPPRIAISPMTASSALAGPSRLAPLPDDMLQATLVQNKRVTSPDHFQDTRHLIFDFEHDLSYEPGDILEIRPGNMPGDVDAFLKTMKWQDIADTAYRIRATSKDRPIPHHWPNTITLRQLFTQYLDIFSVPRRSFFEWLSYFTPSELEVEKLQWFCTAEGQEDLHDYTTRPRRTIHEVMQEFRSAVIPLEYITDIFPEIRPRQFSIASSCRKPGNERRVELLVAIVRYRTKLKLPRKGVATAWLATLQPGQKVAAQFVTGSMRLPENLDTPVIAVGPGTGVAPFRAFAQERSSTPAGDTLVFFGCRSQASDFYFADEWASMASETQGRTKLVLAASRDQEDKIYVQHRIAEHGETLWKLIGEQKGIVYLSGASGQMPKSVQKALKTIFRERAHMSEDEAERYFDAMESEGRYQEETWS